MVIIVLPDHLFRPTVDIFREKWAGVVACTEGARQTVKPFVRAQYGALSSLSFFKQDIQHLPGPASLETNEG